MNRLLAVALFLACAVFSRAEDFLPGVRRIVFLGDSITYAGHYVDQFEAYLAVGMPGRSYEVINLGLPSETVSGLSEPGHADGKFPRPDLNERLARALEKSKPDVVIACYGMNDGIYQPFDEKRFRAFKEGMTRLHEAVLAINARIVHLTPPVFDSQPIQDKVDPTGERPGAQFAGYDEVLARYSAWLVSKRSQGWRVVDVHSAMRRVLDSSRAADANFTFSKDGVHPNEAGHWIISTELVGELAGQDRADAIATMNRLRDPAAGGPLVALIRERGRTMTDAWLSAVGHQRPGMKPGLPLDEAHSKAEKLDLRIQRKANAFIKASPPKPS